MDGPNDGRPGRDRDRGLSGVATDGPLPADRGRPVYLGACRIDIVRRAGTREVLTDARLARTIARALEAAEAPVPVSLTVVLTDDDELGELNKTHLGKDGPTDVLSFPMLLARSFPPHAGQDPARLADEVAPPGPEPMPGSRTHLGDIAISVERAIDQAESGHGGQTGEVRWSAADELRLLVTHGALHICGWDHAKPAEEAAMRDLEQRLLAEERR
ncbi:MAG TPA: rRNA maturation RNase YbeY [Candidatus Limnocylindrales bacterium]|nr:rRNA maturation RNase YbeY [Candidatus Limnocylindrales bacterium]